MELDHWYSCKKIGEGGYGNVYSIDNLNLVVKLVPLNELSIVELDTMCRLRHRNIVQAIDFGIFRLSDNLISKVKLDSKNMTFVNFGFVMEKAVGDLKHYTPLGDNKKERIIDIVEQIKDGLYYLHKNKIIHADIKPQNILLYIYEDKINAKIADFGLSKYALELKTTDTLANTIGYRPPEIVNKTANYIDNSIDYWALGNVIYNIVTGLSTSYFTKGDFQDYFGNKTQEYIDDKIYNDFMKLGYPELIDFTQKCLTVNYTNIRIPPEKINKIDIGYNLSIYKNNIIPDYDIKSIINVLLSLDSRIGYDIILKTLQFYISNYDSSEDSIHISRLLLELYIKRVLINTFSVGKYYIKIQNKLNDCSGIINNYSLYDTLFRDIEKIQSLDDYNLIFENFLEI